MSVVLYCPVPDRQPHITFPIRFLSLFGFGIVRASLYCTVFPGETTFFGVLTCKQPKKRYPNYLQPQWLVLCSKPAHLTLLAYILAAEGIRASSPSYAHAHKDA